MKPHGRRIVAGMPQERTRGDWRSVFLAVAVVSAVTSALAAAAIPGGALVPRRPDVAGALLLGTGLVAALLPISEGTAWGWTSWRVIGLPAVAVLLLTGWAVTEVKLANPLIRLGVLALPGVSGGILLFLVTAATVAVINLTVPSFLQTPASAGYGAAASVLGAGLALLPFALAITAAGSLARHGNPRVVAVASLSCEALALGLLAAFHHSPAQVVILVAVFGAGHGGTLTAEYVLLTRTVLPEAAGAVVGLASAVATHTPGSSVPRSPAAAPCRPLSGWPDATASCRRRSRPAARDHWRHRATEPVAPRRGRPSPARRRND
jgi:hypothetical protein